MPRITFGLPLAFTEDWTEADLVRLIGQRWDERHELLSRPGRIIGARREEDGAVYLTVEVEGGPPSPPPPSNTGRYRSHEAWDRETGDG